MEARGTTTFALHTSVTEAGNRQRYTMRAHGKDIAIDSRSVTIHACPGFPPSCLRCLLEKKPRANSQVGLVPESILLSLINPQIDQRVVSITGADRIISIPPLL
jgi:hypothetical protein